MTIGKILFYFIVMPLLTAVVITIIYKIYEFINDYIRSFKDMLEEQKYNPKLRYFIVYLNLLGLGFLLSLIIDIFYELPFWSRYE